MSLALVSCVAAEFGMLRNTLIYVFLGGGVVRSIRQVVVEVMTTAVLFVTSMALCGVVISLLELQTTSSSPGALLTHGFTLAFGPTEGIGGATLLWFVAIAVVALATRNRARLTRFAAGVAMTVIVTVIMLCATMLADRSAAWSGVSAGVTLASFLALVMAAVVSLAVVHFVVFRDEQPGHQELHSGAQHVPAPAEVHEVLRRATLAHRDQHR